MCASEMMGRPQYPPCPADAAVVGAIAGQCGDSMGCPEGETCCPYYVDNILEDGTKCTQQPMPTRCERNTG